MLNNKKALLFDLDGTLCDSMGVWKQIDIEYLGKLGHELPDNLQQCIEGMCFRDTAIYFKDRFNIEDPLEEIEATWNKMALDKYSNVVKLKKGVPEFLAWAKRNGLKMGIATSNSRVLCEAVLKAHDIFKYFDCIITGDEVHKSKPDPDVYLSLAKSLETKPENCLVFEDIIPGIMAGKNAGIEVCAVDDSYSLYSKDEKMKLADYYIYDYKEIIR